MALSRHRLVQRHYVVARRIDDAFDQRRQPAQHVGFLFGVGVSVVDAFYAADRVTQDALGVFALHAGAAHQRARRAPTIMQPPALDAAALVERPLVIVPERARRAVVAG